MDINTINLLQTLQSEPGISALKQFIVTEEFDYGLIIDDIKGDEDESDILPIIGHGLYNKIKSVTVPQIQNNNDPNDNIHFLLFRNKSLKCNKTATNIISNCACLQRICITLKDQNDEVNKNKLAQFCKENYTNYLDDMIHFMKEHATNDQLLQIKRELNGQYGSTKCELNSCSKLTRHYGRRRQEYKNSNIEEKRQDIVDFYSDCFDQIHHHIYHLFALGLRFDFDDIKIEDNKNDQSETIDFLCIDKTYQKKRELIKLRQKQIGLNIERYHNENNKFNLNVTINDVRNQINTKSTQSNTFLDEMYLFIQRNEIKRNETDLIELIQYIAAEQYDSDSIKQDLYGFTQNTQASNLYNNTKNKQYIHSIMNYIANTQLSTNAFETGYIFLYWDYFKTTPEAIERMNGKYQQDRHNGHSGSELFVSALYKNLKEEILESRFVWLREWNGKVVLKGKEYYKTEKVKCMTGGNYKHDLKFGPISLYHLYCIILYCDMDNLQYSFSCTFRSEYLFESLESIKRRHQKYYHFSKALIEAVNDFGINGNKWKSEYEHGPFYFGLSVTLNIYSFAIYLKSPCSTTKDIQIAERFANIDDNGLIIQLQNNRYPGEKQTFFDCSWISGFSEENERLFVHGQYRLWIDSIIIPQTAQNFEQYMHSFYLFDALISGVWVAKQDDEVNITDVLILDRLVGDLLNNSNVSKKVEDIPCFIRDTFKLFLAKKNEIRINIQDLDKHGCFEKLKHLIMNSVVNEYAKYNRRKMEWDEYIKRDISSASDNINVFNAKILCIFPNIIQVVINTTYQYSDEWYYLYRFSFLSFLESIESSKSNIKYIIKAQGRTNIRNTRKILKYIDHEYSWLNNILTEPIKQRFKNKKWIIKFENGENKWGYYDCVIIHKPFD